jgi:hypothetical protein
MSKITTVAAAAIALVFGLGVVAVFAKSTPEAAKLAVSAPTAAFAPTTTTSIPAPVVEAPPLAPIIEAPTSAVAPKPAPAAPKPAPPKARAAVAPKPAPVAPEPTFVLPVVVPPAPVIAAPATTTTTTTTAPKPIVATRGACTDSTLDRNADLSNMSVDEIKSFMKLWNATYNTSIYSYAQCVALGGEIDPRHSDFNGLTGDGKYCGPQPTTASTTAFGSALTAQSACWDAIYDRIDSGEYRK